MSKKVEETVTGLNSELLRSKVVKKMPLGTFLPEGWFSGASKSASIVERLKQANARGTIVPHWTNSSVNTEVGRRLPPTGVDHFNKLVSARAELSFGTKIDGGPEEQMKWHIENEASYFPDSAYEDLVKTFRRDILFRNIKLDPGNVQSESMVIPKLENYVMQYSTLHIKEMFDAKNFYDSKSGEVFLILQTRRRVSPSEVSCVLTVVAYTALLRDVDYVDNTQYTLEDVLNEKIAPVMMQPCSPTGMPGCMVVAPKLEPGLYQLMFDHVLETQHAVFCNGSPLHLMLVMAGAEIYDFKPFAQNLPMGPGTMMSGFKDRLLTYNNLLQLGADHATLHFADLVGQVVSAIHVSCDVSQLLLYDSAYEMYTKHVCGNDAWSAKVLSDEYIEEESRQAQESVANGGLSKGANRIRMGFTLKSAVVAAATMAQGAHAADDTEYHTDYGIYLALAMFFWFFGSFVSLDKIAFLFVRMLHVFTFYFHSCIYNVLFTLHSTFDRNFYDTMDKLSPSVFLARKPKRRKRYKQKQKASFSFCCLFYFSFMSAICSTVMAALPGFPQESRVDTWRAAIILWIGFWCVRMLGPELFGYVKTAARYLVDVEDAKKRKVRRSRSESDVEIGLKAHSLETDTTSNLTSMPKVKTVAAEDLYEEPPVMFPTVGERCSKVSEAVSNAISNAGLGLDSVLFGAGIISHLRGHSMLKVFCKLVCFMNGPDRICEPKKYYRHTAALLLDFFSDVAATHKAFIFSTLAKIGLTFNGKSAHSAEVPDWTEDLQYRLKGLKRLRDTQLLPNMSKFMALVCITPVLGKEFSKSIKEGSITSFYEQACRQLSEKSLCLDSVIDTCLYWTKFSLALKNTKFDFLAAARFAGPVSDERYVKCIELDAAVNAGTFSKLKACDFFEKDHVTGLPYDDAAPMTYDRVMRYYLETKKRLTIMDTSDDRSRALAKGYMIRMNNFIQTLDLKRESGTAKMQPFVITLYGPAGIGKSSAMRNLMSLMHAWGGDTAIENTKMVVEGDKYDSAFDNSTTGACWDDAGQIRPEVRPEPLTKRLFSLVSTVSAPFNKADLESKGVCFNNLKYVCMSTNSLTLGVESELTCMSAGLRRLGVVVEVRLIEQFATKAGMLNSRLVSEDLTRDSVLPYWLEYRAFTMSSDDTDSCKKNKVKSGTILRDYVIGDDDTFVDFRTFMTELHQVFQDHWSNQRKAMSRESSSFVLCPCGKGMTMTTCTNCSVVALAHGSERPLLAQSDTPPATTKVERNVGFDLWKILPFSERNSKYYGMSKSDKIALQLMEDPDPSKNAADVMVSNLTSKPFFGFNLTFLASRLVSFVWRKLYSAVADDMTVHMLFNKLSVECPSALSACHFSQSLAYQLIQFASLLYACLCFYYNVRLMWLVFIPVFSFMFFMEGFNYIIRVVTGTAERKVICDRIDSKSPFNNETSQALIGAFGVTGIVVGGATIVAQAYKHYMAHDGITFDEAAKMAYVTMQEKKDFLKNCEALPAEERKNIWTKPMQVPIVPSDRGKGMTFEQVVPKVVQNLYRVNYSKAGTTGDVHGLFLDGNVIVTPLHSWMLNRVMVPTLEVEYFNDGERRRAILEERTSHKPFGKDFVLSYIPGVSRYNLGKLIAKEPFKGEGSIKIIRRKRDGSLDDILNCIARVSDTEYMANNVGKIYLRDAMCYSHPNGFQNGDCISPVLSDANGTALVGFHIAGDGTRGVATTISRSDYDAFIKMLQEKGIGIERAERTPPITKVPGKEVPYEPVHPKHPINHMPPFSNAKFHDSVMRGFTPRSSVVVNPLVSIAQDCLGLKENFGKPNNNVNKAIHPVMALSTSNSPVLDSRLREAIVKDYLSGLPEGTGRVNPYSLEEALNGIPGNSYLFTLSQKTSAGFPWNTKKTVILEGETGFVRLKDEVMDLYNETLRKYAHGELSGFCFNTFPKDEPRTLDKLEVSRVIFGGNAIVQILSVQYLGPVIHFLQKAGQDSMTAVGLDPVSPDWHMRCERMLNTDYPELGIETDFSKFDMSIPKCIIESVCVVLRSIAKDKLEYTRDELRIVDSLLTEILCPLVNFAGVILEPEMLWPSGSYITATGGSIAGCLLYMFSFYKHNSDLLSRNESGDCNIFRKYIHLMDLGDDNTGAVIRMSNWDMEKFKQDMLDAGMQATTAVGKSTIMGHKSVKNLEFLKRVFRYDEEIGHVVGALDPNSIFKWFEYYIPSSDPMLQRKSSMETMIFEMFLHGREAFTEFMPRLRELVEKSGSPWFDRLDSTFDDMLADHKKRHGEVVFECPKHAFTGRITMPWMLQAHAEEHVGVSDIVTPPTVVSADELYYDPSREINSGGPTVQQAFDREVLLVRETIPLSLNWFYEFNPYSILENEFLKPRLSGFTKLVADVELRFAISCGPSTSGMLLVSWYPFKQYNDSNGFESKLTHVQRLALMMSRQNMRMDLQGETTNKFVVRYCSYDPVFTIGYVDPRGNSYDIGSVQMTTIAPPFDAYGQTTGIIVSIYARLINYRIDGPSYAAHGEEIPKERISSKISAVASIARVGAAAASSAPSLALPFEVAAETLDGIAGAARLLGYSRPADVSVKAVVPTLGGSMAVANVDMPIKKLTVDADRQTTLDGRAFGSEFDELLISSLISKPCVVDVVDWKSTDPNDTVIYTQGVSPFLVLGKFSTKGEDVVMSPAALVSSQFRYWRGTVHYRFTVIAPPNYAGILTLLYQTSTVVEPLDVTRTPNFQMDISVTKVFEYSVHWTSPKLMLRCSPQANGGGPGESTNGLWKLVIVHPLRGSGSVEPACSVLIEQWADPKMIFSEHRTVSMSLSLKTDIMSTKMAGLNYVDNGDGRNDSVYGADGIIGRGDSGVLSKGSTIKTQPPLKTSAPTYQKGTKNPSQMTLAPTFAHTSETAKPSLFSFFSGSSAPTTVVTGPAVVYAPSTMHPTMAETLMETYHSTIAKDPRDAHTAVPTQASTQQQTVNYSTNVETVEPTASATLLSTPAETTGNVAKASTVAVTTEHTAAPTTRQTAEPTQTPTYPPCTTGLLTCNAPLVSLGYGSITSNSDSYTITSTASPNLGRFPVYWACGAARASLTVDNLTSSNITASKITVDLLHSEIDLNTTTGTTTGWEIYTATFTLASPYPAISGWSGQAPIGYSWEYIPATSGVGGTPITVVDQSGKSYSAIRLTMSEQLVFPGLINTPDNIVPLVIIRGQGLLGVSNSTYREYSLETLPNRIGQMTALVKQGDVALFGDNGGRAYRFGTVIGMWYLKFSGKLTAHAEEVEKLDTVMRGSVGVPGGEEHVYRLIVGEHIASIRQLLKIFRPLYTYEYTEGSATLYTYIYDASDAPALSCYKLFLNCFNCVRGSVVIMYRLFGDGYLTAYRGSMADYIEAYDLNLHNGYEVADSRINPCLVVEYPSYTYLKYHVPRWLGNTLNTSARIFTLDANTGGKITADLAVGEDFMLAHFIGSPIFTVV